eukprot:m51a1_g8222 putative ras guanyl-releasing protein 1 (289) ;mRNA; f:107093-108268
MSTAELEGFLDKQRHSSSWSRAWCIAQPGLFCYFKSPTAKEPSGQVALADCAVSAEGTVLVLRTPARELRFRAQSAAVVSEWLSAISRALALSQGQKHHTMHRTRGLPPVYCAACGKVIWGIGKTGYTCLAPQCRRAVHLRCADALAADCKGFAAPPASPQTPESRRRGHKHQPSASGSASASSCSSGAVGSLHSVGSASASAAAVESEATSERRKLLMSELGRLEAELADVERLKGREELDVTEHWAAQKRQYIEELWRRELVACRMEHEMRKAAIERELTTRGAKY